MKRSRRPQPTEVWLRDPYGTKLDKINQEVLGIIEQKALSLGANAVLGLRVDHDEISGGGKSMLMVTASGGVSQHVSGAAFRTLMAKQE